MSRIAIRAAALTLGALLLGPAACSPDGYVTEPAPAPALAPLPPASGPNQLLGLGGLVGGVVNVTTNLLGNLLGLAVCEPLTTTVASRTIGSGGGVLWVGPHKLYVPAGALASDVKITGTTLSGSDRGVDFQPHGLRFSRPVTVTLSYDRCTIPSNGTPEVVYTDADNQIIARQPSVNEWWYERVVGVTDHFSGYVVAIGRSQE